MAVMNTVNNLIFFAVRKKIMNYDGSFCLCKDSNVKCQDICNEKLATLKEQNRMKNSAKLLKKPYLIEGQHKNKKVCHFSLF